MATRQHAAGGGAEGSRGSAAASAYFARPSGTRWIPTGEQVRILRDLFDNRGVRSPNSEQIQRIAAMLRQYGKIEGKNVFYWFQNHKARERQKKRLTGLDIPHGGAAALVSPGAVAAPSPCNLYASSMKLEASTCSTPVAERSFLDYLGVRSALDAAQYYTSEQAAATTRELETLPLFPVADTDAQVQAVQQHEEQEGQDLICSNNNCWPNSQWYEQHHPYSNHFYNQDAAAAGGTSLELTLRSYYCTYPAGSM